MKFQFPHLKAGDTVALACPSSRCQSEQDSIIAKTYLEKHGLQAVYREECYSYVSTAQKAQIFIDYLFDDNIKMIWALRGGEGCADILPYLEIHKASIKKLMPKLLCGCSDFTVLLNYFAFQYDWPVIHGEVAGHVAKDPMKQLNLDVVLGQTHYAIDGLAPLNQVAISFSDIHAVCCGGTLALLNISIADVWQFDTAGKIILIEDVNEKSYQISRTLKYLQRIGFFKNAKAVIFGDFNAKPIGATVEEQEKEAVTIMRYLQYFAESVEIPVFYTNKFAHGKLNYPIILNYPAVLSAEGKLSFTKKEPEAL